VSINRFAVRRDTNEELIIDALMAAGCDVLQGRDVDLIVGRGGVKCDGNSYLLEVKAPGCRERLTKIQLRLRDTWRGHYAIVTSAEEALKAVGL
jgi:hypothetical protein